ncbi:MAG: nuclear transport factor 2 family protein [Solirubrobacterales bacterium]
MRFRGSDEEKALRAAERELQRAQLESDVAALDALIHEQLRFTGPDGIAYNKQDDLDAHRSGAIKFASSRERELSVEVSGETGVTRALMEMSGQAGGQPFDGAFRYTRTWLLEDGRWQIVAARASAVS